MKVFSKRTVVCGLLLAVMLTGAGCAAAQSGELPAQTDDREQNSAGGASVDTDNLAKGTVSDSAASETAVSTESGAEGASDGDATAESAASENRGSSAEEADCRGVVVLDPGHQEYGNLEGEPIGPGASETKAKVSYGTSGVASGVPEYKLTLDIGLKLRAELEERGYRVIMTRETHDVDISNSERAEIANEAEADAFVRIHANGSGDGGVTGAMTICQTPGNAYNGDLYEKSRALSDCILDSYVLATGIRYERVWETDSMSGINWSRVPVTIIEMGYMSNSEEDLKMQDPEMQEQIVDGIANGIDAYIVQYPREDKKDDEK